MKANSDNSKDNVAKTKKNIDSPRPDMEAAYEMCGKDELRAENKRRNEALKGTRNGTQVENNTKK